MDVEWAVAAVQLERQTTERASQRERAEKTAWSIEKANLASSSSSSGPRQI